MIFNALKICYVLTSSGKDAFANMAFLSIFTLRLNNPDVCIVLLCDKETKKTLIKFHHIVLDIVDEVIAVNTPSGPGGFRNRYIKTSMRRYIKGSFLYLDGDTLIRDDLMPIFSSSSSFSAAPNHSGQGSSSEIPVQEHTFFHHMNWDIPEKYVNGGVLFFSDHPDVYDFFELWHQKWLSFNLDTEKHFDQPSLNSTLHDSNINFLWLDNRYNAQIQARPQTVLDAVIWHFYFSDRHPSPKTIFDISLTHLAEGNIKPHEFLYKVAQLEHPWIVNNPIDRIAIKSILSKNQILNRHSWECLWLADDYIGTCKLFLRSIKHRAQNYIQNLQ